MPPGTPLERYPAQRMCSGCGLCDSSFISEVTNACAFLGAGFSRGAALELETHGAERKLDDENELYFGVGASSLRYAKMRRGARPSGAAWTGIVTSIAAAALEQGLVDAVIGVGAVDKTQPYLRMEPWPVLCRTPAEVLAHCPGVKPVLANSLSLLDEVRDDPSIRRLLFLGVGCQVQALRSVGAEALGLDALYVLGTNCADNVRSPEALRKFMRTVSSSPETAVGFEFMQDYRIHVKHVTGLYEKVPVFTLPSEDLKDVIAESCYSCFDYSNGLADLVVGYMATPDEGVEMTEHSQYVVSRNPRGDALLALVTDTLELAEPTSRGSRLKFATQVTQQDLETLFLGAKPKIWALPRWVGDLAARLLGYVGPSGLEFAKNSIDYHQLRNAIHVRVREGKARADEHIPQHAREIERRHYPGFTDELADRYSAEIDKRSEGAANTKRP